MPAITVSDVCQYIPSAGVLGGLTSYNPAESVVRELDRLEDGAVPISSDEFHEFSSGVLENDTMEVRQIIDALVTGRHPGGYKINDVMMSQDYPALIGAATEILLMNRIMPRRVISQNLFMTIPYSGSSTNVTLRTLGGVKVEEVPEGGLYPSTSTAIADQAYRIFLEVKKYGAKVAATKELKESDNWGIFFATLMMLADELGNNKEKMCMRILNEQAGYVLFDNANAANVPLGSATGRGIDGNFNGALGFDDIMNIIAYMEMRGYYIDTALIHPFAWSMFQRDSEIRECMLGTSVQYVPGSGQAAAGWGDPYGGLGAPASLFGSGIATTTPALAQAGLMGFNTVDPIYGKLGVANYAYPNLTPFGATYMAHPQHLDRPLKIIVTPLVPYYKIASGSAAGKFATNMIFADSRKCGLILQKENPVMEQWSDDEREIDFTKVRERFACALQEQGRAVAVARNIVIDRTYAFDNVNSVALSPISTITNRI